jgi:hypothetical protein
VSVKGYVTQIPSNKNHLPYVVIPTTANFTYSLILDNSNLTDCNQHVSFTLVQQKEDEQKDQCEEKSYRIGWHSSITLPLLLPLEGITLVTVACIPVREMSREETKAYTQRCHCRRVSMVSRGAKAMKEEIESKVVLKLLILSENVFKTRSQTQQILENKVLPVSTLIEEYVNEML